MKFQSFKNWLNENALMDTFWENDKTKLFLRDILKYLDNQKVKTTYIDTNKIKNLLIDAERDEERVQKSNLRYPLIVTQSKYKFINVLDGQHRLEKALTNNIDKLKIRILDLDTAPEEYKELFIKDYKPTPDLLDLANKFLLEKDITKDYLKKQSGGLCWWFAKNFSKYLDSKNIDSKIVNMEAKSGGNHLVVKVGDSFIDFTMNQFRTIDIPDILNKDDYFDFFKFKEFDSFEDVIKNWSMNLKEWKIYEKRLKHPDDFGDFNINFKIDGVEVPIAIIPKEKWPEGKNDPTEFDSDRKMVNIRSDYDYKKDPLNWLSHELIHYQRDKKGIKDDGKEYPTNNTEEAAYIYQFKKFKKQGIKNFEDLPNLGKSRHKQILKKYWDNV